MKKFILLLCLAFLLIGCAHTGPYQNDNATDAEKADRLLYILTN